MRINLARAPVDHLKSQISTHSVACLTLTLTLAIVQILQLIVRQIMRALKTKMAPVEYVI